jgi:hypothetical protein
MVLMGAVDGVAFLAEKIFRLNQDIRQPRLP